MSSVASVPSGSQAYPDPIPGVIPFGSVCLFAGASGVGKTIMQAEWCARMRDGRTICGHPTNRPTGFYYLAADRDWSTYAAAFEAAGFPDIHHYALAEDDSLDPKQWRPYGGLDLFDACMGKLAPIPGSIVYVDPVAPLFIMGKQNEARDVAISMHWLRRIARVRQITLICDANVGKIKLEDTYRRPQDRISGSGAFAAYSDTQLYLVPELEPVPHVIFGWTPRRAKAEEFTFKFDEKTQLFVPYSPPAHAKADKSAQLLPLIPDEGIDSSDLEERATEQLHISRATYYRWLAKLLTVGYVHKDAYGFVFKRKSN